MKKVILTYISCLVVIVITLVSGCSDSNEQIVVIEEPTCPNPIASEPQIFGQNGSIYKPSGDPEASGAGKVVVLLDPAFSSQFDECKIKTGSNTYESLTCINDAPWTQVPFSCFSNPVAGRGLRQTWRSGLACEDIHRVEVICTDSCQSVTFKAPQGSLRKVCERLG